ncbi:PREDICTED: E3 ubiquitin-protein ligase Topors-like [Poecilia mexicana]|uniref:E3 ubiquitin-protein ligase Topors n=1 Tax=Poecilia mexicana TaxID=48701 RepID=A0A3B3YT38_9TELE|nr:PREDICTED: E3 ubiquitin-protein ligase Topors-like [Poecilia mexicana]
MPLPARRRRKKGPDEEERATGFSAEVMAPTRMKLRRRDTVAAAAPAGGAPLEADADRTRESRRSSRRKNTTKTSAPAAPASSPPSTSSGAARPAMAAEASPDSKCPICLDRFNNLAYLDHCLHRFCFPCIQEWSHNKAECPLCKQPFASILHSVRAEDDFKEYTLQPPPRATNQLTASTFLTTVAAMTADGAQHHLRLMLRRHLVAADRDAVRRRRRRERAASGRRATDRVGEWEFFMHSPPLPVSPYHLDMSELIMDNMRVEEVAEEMMRRDEERRQVLSEELAGLRGAAAPSTRASRRLMCRLAVRQRLQREGGTVQMREREVTAFRKALYQSGIRVRGISGNQGRPRSVTAETFRRGTSHLTRLNGWLRRELAVLLGPHAPLSDVVLRTITARVLRSGLEDAAAVEEDLRPFLLARTEHFVHELVSFARSSLSMESYDQLAVYEPPAAAMELEPLSSPSDGSSVIAISEEEEEEGGGRAEAAAGRHDDVIQTGSSLSLSGWDDETPGPSYTSAEPPHSLTTPPPLSPAPQQPANQEGAEPRGEEEECLIVGYKKPIAERTPELVQLSSDSEEDEGEKKKEEEEVEVGSTTVDKTPPPPAPYLPIIPPSTSGAFRAEQQKEANSRRRSGSWSESSGRSRKSVCSLSPATPDRRRRDRKQQGDRRRKKKKQRGRDQSREPHGKSGTFCNPNRSIFPPMMSRCSPSPFDSSADSASSPPPSPPDSGWELRFSQVSPLTSSVSSPSRSFSPLCSSPGTPPSPPCSPKRPHHVEKPGGKRKYKSRHLNSSKDSSWRPSRGRQRDRERKKRLRREAERRDSSLKTGSRRSRDDRSPSVEIIYEGTIDSGAAQPSAHKRHRRRHRRAQVTSSPVIITLDSDSSHDNGQKKTNSGSSSPLSSQQTIDFSDLPSLPLAPSAGVGGAVEVGELPADILDRGSDGSESEAAVRSRAARRGDRSDHSYVDIENMEDAVSLLETSDDQQPAAKRPGHREDPSDRYLLEAILDDLNRIAPPRQNLSQDGGFLSENRERTPQEVIRLEERTDSGPTSPTACQQNPDSVPPPLERMEGREVPPLLRRASPVGSYHRNTPPPLKHKDAGSPPHSAASPPNVGPRRSSDPNPTSRNSPGLNPLAIPPIPTIQNQLSMSPSASGATLHSASPRLPARSGSDRLPSLRFGSFPSIESFHSSESLKLNLPLTPATSSHSPDLHPAHRRNPVSPTRRVGAGGLGPSGWDFFSGLNSHGAAAFRPDRPPAGGVRPVGAAAAGGQEVGVPPLSGSASNHKALAPPPSQHALCFIQSERSSQSESRSELIRLPESDSASQNRNNPSSAALPGSQDQNQEQNPHTEPLGTQRHDPAHHNHDPTHHTHDPAHHTHDPAHHTHDPAHHTHDPIRLPVSPHNFSFDSAHRQSSSRLSGPAHFLSGPAHLPSGSAHQSSHRNFEPLSDNQLLGRPSDRLSGEIPP